LLPATTQYRGQGPIDSEARINKARGKTKTPPNRPKPSYLQLELPKPTGVSGFRTCVPPDRSVMCRHMGHSPPLFDTTKIHAERAVELALE
jgi:hypothetical protein